MLLRLREHLERSAEQPFDPAELERLCGYSYDYLSRLFKSRFHMTPHAYHMERKAAVAERLLAETALSITTIAERLHFASIHHFSKWFKRRGGEVPSAYRSRRRIL
jgi:AraC-like DNA-binding protein